MKPLALAASAACLIVLLLPRPAVAAESVVWNNPVAFSEPGLTHHSWVSKVMGLEVGYSVWLPPEYENSKEAYPVMYFLHGIGGTESADAPAVSRLVAARVQAQKIPPLICVFANGGRSGYRDIEGTNVQVETMITQELVPLIDRTYRTKSDRMSRVLAGFSMGGGGSIRLALRHPEMFSAAASWAAALVRPTNDGSVVPEFDAAMIERPRHIVRLLMIVGYEDLTYPWHAPTIAALQAAKYPFTFHTIEGLGHELGRYYDLTSDELLGFVTRDFGQRR